jgi:hypothetical protein
MLGRAALRVAETTRLTKVVVPYRLGDLITVIAVKPDQNRSHTVT